MFGTRELVGEEGAESVARMVGLSGRSGLIVLYSKGMREHVCEFDRRKEDILNFADAGFVLIGRAVSFNCSTGELS